MNRDYFVKRNILKPLRKYYIYNDIIKLVNDVFKTELNEVNLIEYLKLKNYELYEGINIIGVRNDVQEYQNFDDKVYFIFLDKNRKITKSYVYDWTTDPSTFYVKKQTSNPIGTARLKADQYIDAYTIGLHKQREKAFVQRGKNPVTVERLNENFEVVAEQTGYFGINIHAPTKRDELQEAVSWSSAGCQVSKKRKDLEEALKFSEETGNFYFTYTLVELKDFNNLLTK